MRPPARLFPGGFVPGDSPVHRLDARIKILGFLILLGAVIAASGPWGYLFAGGVTAAAAVLTALPLRAVLGHVRRLWWFFILIFLMNALFFDAGDPLWSFWIFRLSMEGMLQGFKVIFRVLLAVILGRIFTASTPPAEITGALESLMRPLSLLGLPADEAAMIIGVAVQFIPILQEEAWSIRNAQTARGARFESPRFTERAASVMPLVIPVFIAAFRRADELATAMEARGYRNARRRTKRPRPFPRGGDLAALALCAGVLVIQIFALG